jgi:hypothetical protein
METKRPTSAMGIEKMPAQRNSRLGRHQSVEHALLFVCMPVQQKEQRHDNRRGIKLKRSEAFRQVKQQQAILRNLQLTSLN